MPKFVRLAVPMALLISLSLLLAACQAQPAPAPAPAAPKTEPTKASSAPAPATTAAPATKSEPTKAAAPAAADMDPKQEWRVNISGEPNTLDPGNASWDPEIATLHLIFEGLLRYDKDLNIIPGIAREIPSVANGGISADGKTYTFKLRDGLKYSDGKALSAKDLEYGLKRSLSPALASDYASFFYDIVGAEEFNSTKEKDATKLQALRDAVGIKAKDDLTVTVTLKQPRASFLSLATLWSMYPVREDIVKANSTDDKPTKWAEDPKTLIGNGPFKMTEWVHQDHITLVPNENYHGAKAKLAKITEYMVPDIQANYAAYLNGEREVSNVPSAMIETVQKDPSASKELMRNPRLATYSVQFNNKKAPFDNQKVRRAFQQALDTQSLIDKVRKGVGKPAYSWVPPGNPGHQADLGKEYKFDVAKAKQMLAEAGYPNGQGLPKVSFQYSNSGNNPIMAQFVQQQWKDNLGIDVTLEPMESKAFSSMVNKLEHTMAFFGWGADYPDPDNWLPELFGTGAGNNKTAYSNPKADDLMKKAIAETDNAKRAQMWADAQKMIVDDVPMAFLFHDESFILVKPYVRDIWFSGMDFVQMPGARSYSQVWIAKH